MMTDEPATLADVRIHSIWDSAINSINEWAVFRIPAKFRGTARRREDYRFGVQSHMHFFKHRECLDERSLRITTKVDADSETLWVKISTKE